MTTMMLHGETLSHQGPFAGIEVIPGPEAGEGWTLVGVTSWESARFPGGRRVLGVLHTQEDLDRLLDESARLTARDEELRAAAAAAIEARAVATAVREAWIAGLPDEIDPETRINRDWGQLEDRIGNRLCGLPPEPVADLGAWVRARIADYEEE